MRESRVIGPNFPPILWALLPIGIWAVVWLTVIPNSGGRILGLFGVGNLTKALHAYFPFLAGLFATAVILAKLYLGHPRGFDFLSPLGLATAYGLVGLAFAWKSPDGFVALRWAGLYLSVPLVVWAIAWGPDSLVHLRRIINCTWLIVILATLALFVMALVKLNLLEVLASPHELFQCKSGGWYDLTAGQLRDTGVGRYSAISAIVSLPGLWRRHWRLVWIIVFVISVVVLLYSGSRGSYMAFAAGAALVVLISGGLRRAATGAAALALIVILAWSFVDVGQIIGQCIFRSVPSQRVEQPATIPPIFARRLVILRETRP